MSRSERKSSWSRGGSRNRREEWLDDDVSRGRPQLVESEFAGVEVRSSRSEKRSVKIRVTADSADQGQDGSGASGDDGDYEVEVAGSQNVEIDVRSGRGEKNDKILIKIYNEVSESDNGDAENAEIDDETDNFRTEGFKNFK